MTDILTKKYYFCCNINAVVTEFVKVIEKRTGLKIACLEEIAWRYHWISTDDLRKQIEGQKSAYYKYMRKILDL